MIKKGDVLNAIVKRKEVFFFLTFLPPYNFQGLAGLYEHEKYFSFRL